MGDWRMDLSINLGQLITAASFVLSVVWGVARMSNRTDEFFRTIKRHEETLTEHGHRLNQHGERLAAIDERRVDERRHR
jgi:hypothetical protein